MTWIDIIVVTIVIVVGLLIMYKALKEPFDMLFKGIASLFSAAKDKVSGTADSGYEVIRYG